MCSQDLEMLTVPSPVYIPSIADYLLSRSGKASIRKIKLKIKIKAKPKLNNKLESDPGVTLTFPLLEAVLTASQYGGSPADSPIIVFFSWFVLYFAM